jgi:hypothetical protein
MVVEPLLIPLGASGSGRTPGILKFLYFWAAGWAIINLGFLGLMPWHIKVLALAMFIPWLPFVGGIVFLRRVYGDKPYLEFSDSAVAFRAKAAPCEVLWRDATSLFVPAKFGAIKAKLFPRILILRTDHVVEPSGFGRVGTVIGLQPGASTVPTEIQYVTELIRRAPARIVDPEVPLLLGLALRASGKGLESLNPADSAIRELLRHPAPEAAPVTAPFEYFLGNIEKGRAQCEAGLETEPGAWDLLLCRALCERALGDEAAWRASLVAALAASPPAEVAPVLALAAGGA